MRSLIRLLAILALVLTALSPAQSLGQEAIGEDGVDGVDETPSVFVKWSAGFDFSRGDYGLGEPTTVYYVPLSMTIDYERLRVRIGLPFIASSGPRQVLAGPGSQEIFDGEAQGLGQLQFDVGYLFEPKVEGRPYVEVTGSVSAPTETRRELGTGLWSLAIQGEIFQRFGRMTPYLSIGRRFYEDCDCDQQLDDRFYASVGMSGEWSEDLSIGIGYDWLGAAGPDIPDSHEIVPYASYWLNDTWSLSPYVVIGLSDGSPDYGVGFSVSVQQ
jgi:hypothetical protein